MENGNEVNPLFTAANFTTAKGWATPPKCEISIFIPKSHNTLHEPNSSW